MFKIFSALAAVAYHVFVSGKTVTIHAGGKDIKVHLPEASPLDDALLNGSKK